MANRDGDGKYLTRGRFTEYENLHRNQLLEFYANYAKDFGIHNLNVMAGYSWAMNHHGTKESNYGRLEDGTNELISMTDPATRNALVSFYGRVNYSIDSRYLFTATMRAMVLLVLQVRTVGVTSLQLHLLGTWLTRAS